MNNRYDLTHNFENIVYNELIYMGYTLQVYNDGAHEIDFVANKGNKQYYIQVAYSVTEEKTYEREFGAFAKLDNSCQKIVITNDDIDYSTSTVRHIQFNVSTDFLLGETNIPDRKNYDIEELGISAEAAKLLYSVCFIKV